MPGLWACSPPAVLILSHLGLNYLTLSSLDGKNRWYGGYTGQEIEASHYPWTGWREASQLCTSPPCLSLELGHESLEKRLDASFQRVVHRTVPLCHTRLLLSFFRTGMTGTTRTSWGQRNYIR